MNIKLPGLIDIHTHLRTPGQSHKEDFYTGTLAAINGGFTTIIDMPNNVIPITSKKLLMNKIKIAKKSIVADVGFHFGSLGDNLTEFNKVKKYVFGLKLYLNQTTGNFIIGKEELIKIFSNWVSNQPILLHAEEDVLDMVFDLIKIHKIKIHICHVSSKIELLKILKAKEKGLSVTCGVTPHHLYLDNSYEKRLGPFAKMKPFLKNKSDIKFLWDHIDDIDIIESDHAPHTILEKNSDAPYGVPGLDTTLPLLLGSLIDDKISVKDIERLCYKNPSIIFNIPVNKTTYIEVKLGSYKLSKKHLRTKSGWSPFEGMQMGGKVERVFIRGNEVFANGEIIARKGSAEIIYPSLN